MMRRVNSTGLKGMKQLKYVVECVVKHAGPGLALACAKCRLNQSGASKFNQTHFKRRRQFECFREKRCIGNFTL